MHQKQPPPKVANSVFEAALAEDDWVMVRVRNRTGSRERTFMNVRGD
jgi:hypothetical protein